MAFAMTTRTEVLAAARVVVVQDGMCPTCLSALVEFRDGRGKVVCPRCLDTAYDPVTGEVAGKVV